MTDEQFKEIMDVQKKTNTLSLISCLLLIIVLFILATFVMMPVSAHAQQQWDAPYDYPDTLRGIVVIGHIDTVKEIVGIRKRDKIWKPQFLDSTSWSWFEKIFDSVKNEEPGLIWPSYSWDEGDWGKANVNGTKPHDTVPWKPIYWKPKKKKK